MREGGKGNEGEGGGKGGWIRKIMVSGDGVSQVGNHGTLSFGA